MLCFQQKIIGWFNKQSKEEQARLNQAFQDYKRSFDIGVAVITTKGVKQVQKIEIPEKEYFEIPLEPMTEEELKIYEEHKRKRNERVFKKFEKSTEDEHWR